MIQSQQVGDGVHFVETSCTNIVLVEDGEDVLLVDAGYPKDRDLVEAAFASIGRSPADCSVAGDALITVDVWDERKVGPQPIRRQFAADREQALASLERLRNLEADVVLPGQGMPYHGRPAAAVAAALGQK